MTKNVPQYTSEIEPGLNPSNSSLSADVSKSNIGQGMKLKRNIPSEVGLDRKIFKETMTKRLGSFRIGKVYLASEALKRADFKTAIYILGVKL